jgi:geranylgeranyl diphosphate synthase, type I
MKTEECAMDLSQASATYLPLIDAEMREVLAIPEDAAAGHYETMQYHMGWLDAEMRPIAAPAGKRIRPMLCLLACAAAGGDPLTALPAAAGLELLHNFSLLHDDIEDNSPLRRHRPTAWTIFGMPITCNAGDGMFSLAHMAFFRLEAQGVPPVTALRALRRFDEMCVALTEGQFLDMSFEHRLSVTPDDYFHMIAGKTGALLAVAPEIGALVAGAAEDVCALYRRYGAALGRAFQLQDDILGIWGDETATGKSAASDILSKKKTLPVIYALAHEVVGPRLAALYAGANFTPADVPIVLALLNAAGARPYVEALVRAATAEAHDALRAAAPWAVAEPHRILGELLDTLAVRSN